jgi:hypothetical protein
MSEEDELDKLDVFQIFASDEQCAPVQVVTAIALIVDCGSGQVFCRYSLL